MNQTENDLLSDSAQLEFCGMCRSLPASRTLKI